jgi:hypothetical protein
MIAMKTLSHVFDWLRPFSFVLLLIGPAGYAQAAKTYTDNGNGTVTDPTTGLVWMRCAMGQTWNGATCTGTAGAYNFNTAYALTGKVTFAGQSDWRLPNVRELSTIVDRSVFNPAIDLVAFPGTSPSNFWSASAWVDSSQLPGYLGYAWFVDFGYGIVTSYGYKNKSTYYQVRLVRSGQSLNLLGITRPDSDYVDIQDGTVTHTPTGLMWQRCAVGQTLSAAWRCTGTVGAYTWDQAMQLKSSLGGHTDWRLPTEDELLSLVDYRQHHPSLNTRIFTDTPLGLFWSASAYPGYSDNACYVDFRHGGTTVIGNSGSSFGNYSRSTAYYVRLVRAGQLLDSLVTTTTTTTTTTVAPTTTTVPVTTTTALATTTTSTVASTTTTTQAATGQTLTLSAGWNLLGNGWNQSLTVASVFGDATHVTTVWKWDFAETEWQFYSPTMTAQDLKTYAANKSFGVLSAMGVGEGFWVNAKKPFTVTLPNGEAVLGVDFQSGGTRELAAGWNLIAIGAAMKASGFNIALSTSPTVAGVVPQNFTTLWAWDNADSKWYFYSPQLESQGGTVLTDYITSKGYLVPE